MDYDVILPTKVVFEDSGCCNVTPVYTHARLRNEHTHEVIFQCNTRSCVVDNDIVNYNFSSLGNVTLHQPVEEVAYLMALIQDCPSGTVLRMTYDVTFTSKEKVAAYIEVLMFTIMQLQVLHPFQQDQPLPVAMVCERSTKELVYRSSSYTLYSQFTKPNPDMQLYTHTLVCIWRINDVKLQLNLSLCKHTHAFEEFCEWVYHFIFLANILKPIQIRLSKLN